MIVDWTAFKEYLNFKDLKLQLIETDEVYYCFVMEGSLLVETELYKNNHNEDLIDFETNYLANANFPIDWGLRNALEPNNSTTTLLTASSVYTGIGVEAYYFSQITISVYSDVGSASDGIEFQFSHDNSTWKTSQVRTFDPTVREIENYSFPIMARYFRVKYTNGGTNQTVFSLQTILHSNNAGRVKRTAFEIPDDKDGVELQKSFLVARSFRQNKNKNILASEDGGVLVGFTRQQTDAFTRLRVTDPNVSIFDQAFNYTADFDLYWTTSTATGGAVNHNSTTGQREIAVTTSNGSTAILQTRRRMQYIKGKSQLIYFTATFGAFQANCRKRAGLFDENNGVFFESSGGAIKVVRRSNVSGSVVDVATSQSSWNIDKLDGSNNQLTNLSGQTFDITKHYLYIIDFSWLGSNIIRYGLIIDGSVVYVHQENTSGVLTVPWAFSVHLPLRYEVVNTGALSGADQLQVSCMTVVSEGGSRREARIKNFDTGQNPISVNTTTKVLDGFRLKSGNKNALMKLSSVLLLGATGSAPLYWRLVLNPTLTGPTWADFTGLTQRLSNTPTYTASTGTIITSGYFVLGTSLTGSGNKTEGNAEAGEVSSDLYLGFDIAGTADVVVLLAETIGTLTSGSTLHSGQFLEFY